MAPLGGAVRCPFDITPAYSPWPVAALWGSLPWRGQPRFGLGAACRERWDDAVDKAFLEWAQATVFASTVAGVAVAERATARSLTPPLRSFEDHARYYTRHPDRAAAVHLGTGDVGAPPPDGPGELDRAVAMLHDIGVRLYERNLTTVDLADVSLHAVRVLSPDLTGIHVNDDWPYLGARTADRVWRYPDLEPNGPYPNPLPHPLG